MLGRCGEQMVALVARNIVLLRVLRCGRRFGRIWGKREKQEDLPNRGRGLLLCVEMSAMQCGSDGNAKWFIYHGCTTQNYNATCGARADCNFVTNCYKVTEAGACALTQE